MLKYESNVFRENQQLILNNYAWVKPTKVIKTDSIHEIDSLLTSFNYTTNQKVNIHSIIDWIIEKSALLIIEQVGDKVIVDKKDAMINEDTKNLLELQYAKIQHEYQELQVWCGILTVIFLIFSFYSVFKADDLIKQGKTGLKELEEIKNSGKNKIDEFQNESKLIIREIKDDEAKMKESFENDIWKKNEENSQIIKDTLNKYTEETKKNLEVELDKAKEKFIPLFNAYQEKLAKTNQSTDSLNVSLDMLKKQLDTIEERIENLERPQIKQD